MELIDLILVFVLGWAAGTMILKFRIRRALHSIRKDMEPDEGDAIWMQLSTECHNGSIFVYNTSTKMFLAQGSTIDEVADRIKALGIKLSHVVHGDDEFWVIDGKVQRN